MAASSIRINQETPLVEYLSNANFQRQQAMAIVVTRTERVSKEIADSIRRFGVATVHEALGRKGLMASYMKPVFKTPAVAGSAVTCEVAPGDNWMIHVAVEQCQEGDILVVTPTSLCDDGYFGDLLATSLQARGVRALIINAGVRDVDTLEDMNFPVWSKTVCAQGTVKETIANVNVPIICAGVSVTPGDLIVADRDGVVVVPRLQADSVLIKSQKREVEENSKRARLANGELGLDIYNMRQRLADKGLRYVEKLPDPKGI
jgi:4-hydroxy-4-methyl-2-oxoglutarate aldolase